MRKPRLVSGIARNDLTYNVQVHYLYNMSYRYAGILTVCFALWGCGHGNDEAMPETQPIADKDLAYELREMRATFQCYSGATDIERDELFKLSRTDSFPKINERDPWIDQEKWDKWTTHASGNNLPNDLRLKSIYYFNENTIHPASGTSGFDQRFSAYQDQDHVAFLVVGNSDREGSAAGKLKVSLQRVAEVSKAMQEAGVRAESICMVPQSDLMARGGVNNYEDRNVQVTAFSLE
ncbi:MAG: hypothetical protein ACRBDL_05205 [Alphaproteobacteria bacterium]